jgi:hypothetical protein
MFQPGSGRVQLACCSSFFPGPTWLFSPGLLAYSLPDFGQVDQQLCVVVVFWIEGLRLDAAKLFIDFLHLKISYVIMKYTKHKKIKRIEYSQKNVQEERANEVG